VVRGRPDARAVAERVLADGGEEADVGAEARRADRLARRPRA
jgi:hypothetical protein